MRRVRRHVLRSAGYFFLSVLFAMTLGCSGGGGSSGGSAGSDSASLDSSGQPADGSTVPLYSVYERSVTNTKSYPNKFTDVTLNVEYTAPSGRRVAFWGFYDGDGQGGQDGNVWKMRFMPDEVGTWTYAYTWSDGTAGESGSFVASEKGAGRGMLRAYGENKHWFAYNGSDPVFLKSYYVGAGGFAGVPIDWAAKNVYGKLVDRGYNHVQLNMLPIGWTEQRPSDAPTHNSKPLWRDTPRVQNLDVWKLMEDHVAWLNNRNVHIHFFMGIDPKPYGSTNEYFALQRFGDMSGGDQEFYVRYLTARLAPYANIMGWNYTWETDGGGAESRMAQLLAEHDPWGHARTYHDEAPASNQYDNGNYTFAGIENHEYFGNSNGTPARDSASHYQSTRDAFRDKPVYMVEGNGLWRACWAQGEAETSITRAAWAVTLAGGSFTWQDTPDCNFGDPASAMFTWPSANPMVDRLDVLYNAMTQDVAFHRLTPANELLSNCWNSFDRWGSVPTAPCYAAADRGQQYVVYKEDGGSFGLSVEAGSYAATWIDTRTGARQPANGGAVQGGTTVTFSAPSTATDWVLVLSAG